MFNGKKLIVLIEIRANSLRENDNCRQGIRFYKAEVKRDLAKYCGVTYQALIGWINSYRKGKGFTPSLNHIYMIKEYFKVETIDFLLT